MRIVKHAVDDAEDAEPADIGADPVAADEEEDRQQHGEHPLGDEDETAGARESHAPTVSPASG